MLCWSKQELHLTSSSLLSLPESSDCRLWCFSSKWETHDTWWEMLLSLGGLAVSRQHKHQAPRLLELLQQCSKTTTTTESPQQPKTKFSAVRATLYMHVFLWFWDGVVWKPENKAALQAFTGSGEGTMAPKTVVWKHCDWDLQEEWWADILSTGPN